MPFEIDEEAIRKALSVDFAHPPMRPIPHMNFPAMVFKHPKKPTVTITENVYDAHGIPHPVTKTVLSEALQEIVHNQEELDAKLAEGWTQKMYVPPPQAKPETNKLYA